MKITIKRSIGIFPCSDIAIRARAHPRPRPPSGTRRLLAYFPDVIPALRTLFGRDLFVLKKKSGSPLPDSRFVSFFLSFLPDEHHLTHPLGIESHRLPEIHLPAGNPGPSCEFLRCPDQAPLRLEFHLIAPDPGVIRFALVCIRHFHHTLLNFFFHLFVSFFCWRAWFGSRSALPYHTFRLRATKKINYF